MGILTELTDEQTAVGMERLQRAKNAFENMYNDNPESYDWACAVMDRIEALEKQVKELEKKCLNI